MTLRRFADFHREQEKRVAGQIRRGQTVAPAVITARGTDGRVNLRVMTGGDCRVSEGMRAQAPGDVVLTSNASTALRQADSSAGLGIVSETSAAPPTLWVESLEPDTFECGKGYTVTIKGRGFSPQTIFGFLSPDGDFINDAVIIQDQRYLDSETYEVDILTSETAEPLEGAPLGFYDPRGSAI